VAKAGSWIWDSRPKEPPPTPIVRIHPALLKETEHSLKGDDDKEKFQSIGGTAG